VKKAIIGFWKNLDLARGCASRGNDREAQEILRDLSGLLTQLDKTREARYTATLEDFCKVFDLEFAPCSQEKGPTEQSLRPGQDLEYHVHEVKPGISLVTCSRNRTENLLHALSSWLACEEISEIIIVDWSSDVPVFGVLEHQGLLDPRVKVLRVNDERHWVLSHAFNVGFRAASHEKILKVDADIVLDRGFFTATTLRGNTFISGDWRLAREGQEFINGFLFIARADLMKANGFNEFITTYGWDDDDLYGRLQELGFHRQCVDSEHIHHLPHGDELRVGTNGKAAKNAKQELIDSTEFKIVANKFLTRLMPVWTSNRVLQPFSIWPEKPGLFTLVRLGDQPYRVSDHVRADAEYYAGLHLLSWKLECDRVFGLDREQLEAVLKARSLSEITAEHIERQLHGAFPAPRVSRARPKLFVDVQHGLGNRLRAIGSAAMVADRDGRELVVVWQPDHHCDCRLPDLFNYQGAVIEESFIKTAQSQNLSIYNYMEAEDGSEKDALIGLNRGRDIYARTAYALNSPLTDWDAENTFLKRLNPTPEVLDLLCGVQRKNALGVHVRMEGARGSDHNSYDRPENWTPEGHEQLHYWRAASHHLHFTKRIDALIRERAADNLFLAADTPETYAIFAERYGDRLTCLERNVFDRSKLQVQYALADVLMLKDCQKLLGSSWSSFTELALRLSDRFERIEMSGTDF